MTDCWKCKFFKSCKSSSFCVMTEHICTKPYTAIRVSSDMLELLSSVGCNSFTAREAEIEATKIPGVISVFVGSALRGDETAVPERPAGVRE